MGRSSTVQVDALLHRAQEVREMVADEEAIEQYRRQCHHMDASLDTSVGCSIVTKKAKGATAMAASSRRVQTSIGKWKAKVTVGLII
jgi:hypothetical protein